MSFLTTIPSRQPLPREWRRHSLVGARRAVGSDPAQLAAAADVAGPGASGLAASGAVLAASSGGGVAGNPLDVISERGFRSERTALDDISW